ncbi:MAG: hypothetical protein IJB96_12905 [Lachnospira sp.]|nr:hypothetical protein [Lachnospira sp.]
MARKKKLVNRVMSAIMAFVMAMAYIPMPVAVSAEETVSTNEASVTTAAVEGQEAVTTEYATLAEAVTAANASEGSTITLLKNVSTEKKIIITSKDITLELNGKVLTGSNSDVVLWIADTGSLTVKSSADGGKITTSDAFETVHNDGTLVVESGIIENTKPENGSTGIKSGGTVTVNGGTISSTVAGLHIREGKVTINDGEISGGAVSVSIEEAELIVNDGRLIGKVYGIQGTYTVVSTVTINDGYIRGDEYALNHNKSSNIIINGGTLSGGHIATSATEQDTGSITLGDGVVLYDENYDVVQLSDATGTVYASKEVPEEAKKIAVSAGGNVTKYSTLAEAVAVANASEGSTVTLLKDVSVAERFDITGKDIVLDLNGNTLKLNADAYMDLKKDGSLTIKSSIEGGKIIADDSNYAISSEGILVVESGTISNTRVIGGIASSAIVSEGLLTVNGGTISGSSYGIEVRGGTTTINGGDISGSNGMSVGVSDKDIGTSSLIVNGGTITATSRGIFAGSVNGEMTVTINGGKIVGNESAVSNGTNCKTTINGGVLTGSTVINNSSESNGVFLGEGVALYGESGVVEDISDATGTVYAIKGDVVATVVKDSVITGYGTLSAAITAAGQEWSVINIVKDIEIGSDMTIAAEHNWYVPNNVTVTLADNVTLTVKGTLTNNGTVSGGTIANASVVNNNGTIGKVVNSGSLYSNEVNSAITGELVINWDNAEAGVVDLRGCYFPNGITVSGTIGEKSVTIADLLPERYIVTDKDGKAIAMTDGQTSVSGAVYIYKKTVAKVTSGSKVEYFNNLAEAFDYVAEECSKATVTLIEDVELEEPVVIESIKELILDLNGKKITYVPSEDGDAYQAIEIRTYDGDTFIIKSSVEGGIIDGRQTESAIYVWGPGDCILESGTVIGGYCGIYNESYLTINGGTVKGDYNAISNSYTTTINGGTFEVTGTDTEEDVAVTLYNMGVITVTGGTFKNNSVIWNDTDSDDVYAVIYGGVYPNGFGVVKGGIIADVVPSNSQFYKTADKTKVTLSEGQTSITEAVYVEATEIVSVTTKEGVEKKFVMLQDAFDYAYENGGSTVKLLDNIKVSTSVTLGKTPSSIVELLGDKVPVILDLNGKTWVYNNEMGALSLCVAELTVKSSADGGSIVAEKAQIAIGGMYSSLIVESGTIVGGTFGIYNMDSEVVVNEGIVKGQMAAIYNDGSTTINGGILEGTDTQAENVVSVYNEGTLIINGGTFNNLLTFYMESAESSSVAVYIAGGIYPNGLGVSGGAVLTDLLVNSAVIYDSKDEKVTVTAEQTSITEAVYVTAKKVASVTTKDGDVKSFAVLQGAFDYAVNNKGSVIKLLDDITADDCITSGNIYLLLENANYTLDLNGKTWTYTGTQGAIMAMNSDITVMSSVDGGKIDAGSAMAGILNVAGTLMVESGTIVGGICNDGTLYINGGTVTGTTSAIYNEGIVTVVGGTLSYSGADGVAVIENYGAVVVEGGKLDGVVTIANYQESEEDSAPTVSIAGGEYTQGFVIDSQNSITAMTIKDAIAEGCGFADAEGNTVAFTDDQTSITGTVSVVSAKNVSVTTKDGVVTYYGYLSAAFAEAAKNPGSIVTLLTDITVDMPATAIGGEFTLDLNGKKYIYDGATGDYAIAFYNADVTIKSSVEGGMIDASDTGMTDAVYNHDGKLTIKSGAFVGCYSAVGNLGTLTIEDGTFKAENFVVYNNGTATINGGSFEYTDEENGALFTNSGKLVINGGVYNGSHTIDYDFSPVIGPIIGEAVIAGGYFADGISVNSYYGTDEETLLKNIIAEGCAFFKADGTAVELEDDQREIAESVTVGAYGDSNSDGIVDIKDAVMLKKHLAGDTETGFSMNQSDVNADGKVDIVDAVKLMKYLAGQEDIVLGVADAG